MLPYFPTPEEEQEDTAWVYERANILRESRQEHTGTQTRALPTIDEQSESANGEMPIRDSLDSTATNSSEQEEDQIPAMSLPAQTNISIETSITEDFEVGDRWWEIDNAISDLETYQRQEQQPLTLCSRCQGRACGLNSRNSTPAETCELGWREFIETQAVDVHPESMSPTQVQKLSRSRASVETQTEIAVAPAQSAREIVLQRNAVILQEAKYRSRTDAPENIIKSCEQTRRQQPYRRTKKRKLSNSRKKEKKEEGVQAMPVLDDNLVVKRRRGRPRKVVAAIFTDSSVQTQDFSMEFECDGNTQTVLCM